jgi:UDP-N-acetylmuramoylalanine--D-glutamate ligase
MKTISKIIVDLKKILKSTNKHLIFDVKCVDNRLEGVVLLEKQKDVLLDMLKKDKHHVIDKITVLQNAETQPAFGYGKAKKAVVDIFKEPINDISKLSPRGINRLRATQALKHGPPFRLLAKLKGWYLIQLFDNTIGWAQTGNISKSNIKKPITIKKKPAKMKETIEKYLGTPYLLGGNSEIGIDCSGFTQKVFFEGSNLILPKYSLDQKKIGKKVKTKELSDYDLIFAKSIDKNRSHVSIFLDGFIYHACLRERKVIRESMEEFKKYYTITEVKRVIRKQQETSNKQHLSKNIHVVGFTGAEGTSLLHYFHKNGYSNITAHDFCAEKDFTKNFRLYHSELEPRELVDILEKTKKLPYKFYFKDNYLKGILEADIIYVPQSWYLYDETKKPITKAIEKGIELKTMMQLYLEIAPCKTIGITGSNGKTTTANLVYHTLKIAGKTAYLVGNDRKNKQILDKIEDLGSNNIVVLEISNRQLKMPLKKSPHISVITNITQNHLTEHKSFEDYFETKCNIFSRQTEADYLIVNEEDKMLSKIKNTISKKIIFNKNKPTFNLNYSKTALKGPHNRENIEAVAKICHVLNLDKKILQQAIDTFIVPAKRLETIFEKDEKIFINDLSSTTPESTINAIKSFDNKDLTLVIGGENKGMNLNELAKEIPNYCNRVIFHEGSISKELVPLIKGKIETIKSTNISETIKKAFEKTQKNGIILFSPVGEKFISQVLNNKSLKALIKNSI